MTRTSDKPTPRKKPYVAPRLICYGQFRDIVQGNSGAQADGGAGNTKKCWIAEVLYGPDSPRTHLLRAWLTANQRRRWRIFSALYARAGRPAAAAIARSAILQRCVRPMFDYLVACACRDSTALVQTALALQPAR